MYPLYKSDSSCVCDASTRISVLFNQEEEHQKHHRRDAKGHHEEDLSKDSSSNEEENSLLNNIYTQTSRVKLTEQKVQVKASSAEKTETDNLSNVGAIVCIQVEEAVHLPKYLSGEERLAPSTYVKCKLLDQDELVTEVAMQTVKPCWNFRKELRLDADRLKKESCIQCVLWRCVGPNPDTANDLQIGIAKIDIAPLFVGKRCNYRENFLDLFSKPVNCLVYIKPKVY